jgi:WD40 repeat protein
LRGWLVEDRDFLRRLQHVGASAEAWAAAGRPDSELYRGARLDGASDALQTRPDQFNDVERDFVTASRAAAQAAQERDRRARRRLGRALVATSVALVVALVAGSVALVQRREATRQAGAADVSRLVALSQSLSATKRDVALLLALEAARRDPGAVTTGALQGAFSSDLSFLRYLRTGPDNAGQIAFSADGRVLYANSQENGKRPVRVDLDTGRAVSIPVRNLDSQTWIASFIPVDSTSALLTRSSDSGQVLPIEQVDLVDGHVLDSASVQEEAAHVTISPDGTRAAVTTVGRTGVKSRVVILDLATMNAIASVDQPGPANADQGPWYGQSAWIDDHRLVVGSPSGRLLVWAPGTREAIRLINDPPTPGTESAYAVRATPDGSQVVAGGSALMAYDVRTGAPSWPSTRTFGGAMAIDPLAHVVWAQEAGAGSSRMFAYDLATGERTQAELDGQHGTVCDARVGPDSTTIAVSSCNEGTVALWALDGATATGAPLEGAGWASSEDLWSPDGAHVAMFRLEAPDAVEVMDVRDGTRRRAEGVVATATNSPIFRRDGVLQTVNDSNHVVEYDPNTGRTHDTGIVLPGGHVLSNIALHEPDRAVYGLDDGTMVVIDTARAQIVRAIKTDLVGVLGVGWSPDGRRLFAAGQTEQAEVLDAATGKKIATLPTPAANVVVSPDGSLMATAAFNGTIRFVDTTTLKQVGDALSGGVSFAAQIQFTPDGRTFITSGLDNTLRIFDVASRRQVGVPIAIASWGAAISRDSKTIAITTDRGVARLSLDAAALRRAACRAAGRNLTAEEWAQYVGGEPDRLCPY